MTQSSGAVATDSRGAGAESSVIVNHGMTVSYAAFAGAAERGHDPPSVASPAERPDRPDPALYRPPRHR